MIPTDRLVASMGLAALASFALVPVFGPLPAVIVLVALLIVATVDVIALDREVRPTVSIEVPKVAQLRQELPVVIRSSRPATVALSLGYELGGPVSPVDVRNSANISIVPTVRGHFDFGEVWVHTPSRLGLWMRRTVLKSLHSLDVWPDLSENGQTFGVESGSGGSLNTKAPRDASLELRSLRAFVGGDDVRHVDWKATAKRTFPVVREWEPERRRSVLFALDAGRLMSATCDGETKFDAALRAMVRVATAASNNGDRVGALVFSDRVRRFVPPLDGRRQALALLQQVNHIAPTLVQSDLRSSLPFLLSLRRRCMVMVLSDIADESDALDLSSSMSELRGTHLSTVALLRGPEVDRLAVAPVHSEPDAYLRAAALLVRQGRSRAIETLSARGTSAFDISTSRLASEVLGIYARARNSAAW